MTTPTDPAATIEELRKKREDLSAMGARGAGAGGREMSDKTLWRDPVKKFRPRNKQAALIIRKANPIHMPPEVIPPPVYAQSLKDELEKEAKARKAQAAIDLAEWKADIAAGEAKNKAIQEQQRIDRARRPIKLNLIKNRMVKQLNENHRRLGLPAPTNAQIEQIMGRKFIKPTPARTGGPVVSRKHPLTPRA